MKNNNAKVAKNLFEELYPICRSITGNGVRDTLQILQEYAPWHVHEFCSGTQVFDWIIPDEWNIKDAYVKNEQGIRVIDFNASNIHVLNYSEPIRGNFSFDKLKDRLYTLPEFPEAIPYRTSYFNRNWGFCLSQNQYDKLNKNEQYEVCIDSTLEPGHLTLADMELKGSEGKRTYIISTYCCHPSLCNDNLSGPILTTLLYQALEKMDLRHNYRFVIAPETIGIITYIHANEEFFRDVDGGFVITTVAGPGEFGAKMSFSHNADVDRVIRLGFGERKMKYNEYSFAPDGSDERQYSSPSFRIPIATITKDKYYEYKEYHTSKDDLDFVSGDALSETLELYISAIEKLEVNNIYRVLEDRCEIQLGKRGLYPTVSGHVKQSANEANESSPKVIGDIIYSNAIDAISWFLFYADGKTDLVTISEKSGVPVIQLHKVAQKMLKENVVALVEDPNG